MTGIEVQQDRRCSMVAGERGNASIEILIWAPIIALLLAVVVLAGRTAGTEAEVQAAAATAARVGSLERTAAGAAAAGTEAATAALGGSGVCNFVAATVDVDQWEAGMIAVTVSCTPTSTGLFGLFSPKTVEASWAESIDGIRNR